MTASTSYQVFNNLIVIPINPLGPVALCLQVNEDKTISTTTGNAEDTPEVVLNKIRKRNFIAAERLADDIKHFEKTKKLVDLMTEMLEGKPMPSDIESGLKKAEEALPVLRKSITEFNAVSDILLEIMMDFNIPVHQISGESSQNPEDADRIAQDLLAQLRGKQ